MKKLSRRKFISQAALFSSLPFFRTLAAPILYHESFKIGCAAITWGDNHKEAIKEISEIGYKGIQLRGNVLKDYSDKPQELKNLLEEHKLSLPMFSSGNLDINKPKETEIERHVENAKFVKSIGGSSIQITNDSRPKDREPTKGELKNFSSLLNEAGRRMNDLGMMICYHNHMDQLGETPEEVDFIMENTNPKFVKLLLDVGHYFQGGGDPSKAILKYKDRLELLHLKDVLPPSPESRDNLNSYKFVELGRGKLNFPSIFKSLEKINFNKWLIVELDQVPEANLTPAECAISSKKYLIENIKVKF